MPAVKLQELGPNFKKTEPRCKACGYDADYILALDSYETLFCEGCLLNVLLDAVVFATQESATPTFHAQAT